MRAKVFCLMASILLLCATSAVAASYYVTVAANAGGTVAVNGTVTKAGKYLLAEGAPVTVAYSSNSGYYLPKVVADKVTYTPADHNTYTQTFTYDGANHKIAATFAKDPTIVASANAGGTVTPSGPRPVKYGADQSFDIASSTGYHIAKVLVDGITPGDFPAVTTTTPTSYSYTFSGVVKKHTLKAQFAINTYSVTTQVTGSGKVTPVSLSAVKYGQSKTFTVTPSKGMKIASLTVNGEAVTDLPSSGSYKLVRTITQPTEIDATFSEYLPTGTARLNGTYNLFETEHGFWQSVSSGNTYVNTEFNGKNIKVVFDGKGGCSGTLKGYNFSPTQSGTNQSVNANQKSESFSGTYAVNDTNGAFTISSGAKTLVTGWVSKDGNTIVIGEIGTYSEDDGTGYEIRQVAGVRAGTSITKASMKGTYNLVGQMSGLWQSTNTSPTNVSEYFHGSHIVATFDGAGGCTVNYSGNEFNRGMLGAGSVNQSSSTHSPSCSYTVASNGVFTLTTLTEGEKTPSIITGWASADGNVALIGGTSVTNKSDGNDYEIEKTYGVKAGESMTEASLSGAFRLVAVQTAFLADLTNNGGPDDFIGNNITATFDGAGGCAITDSGSEYRGNNGSGTVTEENWSNSSSACSYTVASNGAFTINMTINGESDSVSGWASADGMTALMGNSGVRSGSGGSRYFSELVYGVKTQAAIQ